MADMTTPFGMSSSRAALSFASERRSRLNDGARTEIAHDDGLSGREKQVLELVGKGYTNKEAAQRLGIAPETIKSHIKHIFRKLAVERRAHAVSRGCSLGLIDVAPECSGQIAKP